MKNRILQGIDKDPAENGRKKQKKRSIKEKGSEKQANQNTNGTDKYLYQNVDQLYLKYLTEMFRKKILHTLGTIHLK